MQQKLRTSVLGSSDAIWGGAVLKVAAMYLRLYMSHDPCMFIRYEIEVYLLKCLYIDVFDLYSFFRYR